ncbi:MAG TPA: hypothetical protein PKE45_14470 [Caldilineaceae bacterium]|nr:hypothetical protein [Caldilineaceae bacterium]
MEITLTLPAAMVERLERQAEQLRVTVADLASNLLSNGLVGEGFANQTELNRPPEELPSLTEVVARIQALPPNPAALIPATITIDDVVAHWQANPPTEDDLTPAAWDQLWAAFEQELKIIDHADNLAEERF